MKPFGNLRSNIKVQNFKSGVKTQFDKLANEGFKQIFDHIDQAHIKRSVDRIGLDKFIEQCAYLAAGSGAIFGSGGFVTMVVGVPLDFANIITQQFRATMAIMYQYKGTCRITFHEFMSLIATSLKVEAGLAITKNMMEEIAEKLMLKLGARVAERLIPVVGAVIGGTANYLFIKRMAHSVKEMQLKEQRTVISID